VIVVNILLRIQKCIDLYIFVCILYTQHDFGKPNILGFREIQMWIFIVLYIAYLCLIVVA